VQSLITLTEAKAKFSEIINRIIFKKEEIVITKKGKKVAVIIPMERYLQESSEGLIGARSALGDLDDCIDEMVEQIYISRSEEKSREVTL
jgi:prevent-host-death family protein